MPDEYSSTIYYFAMRHTPQLKGNVRQVSQPATVLNSRSYNYLRYGEFHELELVLFQELKGKAPRILFLLYTRMKHKHHLLQYTP